MTVQDRAPRIAVAIASVGRPDCLASLIARLQGQSLAPNKIVLSVVTDDDLPPPAVRVGVEAVMGPKGLPAQRNTALRHLGDDHDLVLFCDDDYLPSRHAIAGMAAFFAAHPDVAAANGVLLADGINSPGISEAEADKIINAYDAVPRGDLDIEGDLEGLYGCNMVYRTSAVIGLWFDERLKLYGWQEDIDFATQVAARGRTVKCNAFAGVHRGVKGARTSGRRLGYSQVVNPLYLIRKGTMSPRFGLILMARNILANHIRIFHPEPWVDRRGRVSGNWIGLRDALLGRLKPERIETL